MLQSRDGDWFAFTDKDGKVVAKISGFEWRLALGTLTKDEQWKWGQKNAR